MTDKQITIDGVDVSGCEYWKGYCRIASLCDYPGHLCEVNPNCYYKQLKAKEQECEELKKIIDEAKNSKLDLKSFLVGEAVQNEYEQQLDQLKAQLLDQEAETLKAGGIIHKLEKTLTEIKEIVQFGFRPYKVCGEHNNYCDVLNEILNKISEVEDGN